MRRRRRGFSADAAGDDPLTLVPNLFDLALVLAVAFLLSALGANGVRETVKKSAGRPAPGDKSKAQKPSPQKATGKGVRVGAAYQLEDGQVIYVPE